jgi:hypothetical protein
MVSNQIILLRNLYLFLIWTLLMILDILGKNSIFPFVVLKVTKIVSSQTFLMNIRNSLEYSYFLYFHTTQFVNVNLISFNADFSMKPIVFCAIFVQPLVRKQTVWMLWKPLKLISTLFMCVLSLFIWQRFELYDFTSMFKSKKRRAWQVNRMEIMCAVSCSRFPPKP